MALQQQYYKRTKILIDRSRINDECRVYTEIIYAPSQLSNLMGFLQFRFKREVYEILEGDVYSKISLCSFLRKDTLGEFK